MLYQPMVHANGANHWGCSPLMLLKARVPARAHHQQATSTSDPILPDSVLLYSGMDDPNPHPSERLFDVHASAETMRSCNIVLLPCTFVCRCVAGQRQITS